LGVDIHLFRPVRDARTSLGWDAQQYTVLFVGRLLSAIKGTPVLLRAIAASAGRLGCVHLHIAGDGPDRVALERLAVELGLADRVSFHGWVELEDLPLYYSASDLCVSSSVMEPFGRVMLESMACGTPFLGRPLGGMADHIADGVNGFLFGDLDHRVLGERIADLLADRQTLRTVGRRGREYVRDHLSWEVIARRVRDEGYRKVVDRPSP
jgi:glycosyltransferase involved in cell wall biosynthesis